MIPDRMTGLELKRWIQKMTAYKSLKGNYKNKPNLRLQCENDLAAFEKEVYERKIA